MNLKKIHDYPPSLGNQPISAPADTSSEVERKFKAVFLKETSKVVVKILEEYRKDETAKIKTKEDFKNLAKKVKSEIVQKLSRNWD